MPRLKHGSRQPVYIENIRTGEAKWLMVTAEADPTNSCASSKVICPECGKECSYGALNFVGDWYAVKNKAHIGICPECAEKYFKKWRERNGE